ncbi:MAG: EAL domain-containing protein [Betaproteobacteria bacterium]
MRRNAGSVPVPPRTRGEHRGSSPTTSRVSGLDQGQIRVLEMIAAGAPLAETLEALVRVIESEVPGMIGSILLLDKAGRRLRHGVAPALPETVRKLIDGLKVGPVAASCGTAAWRREAVIVEDTSVDPLWADYRDVALAHGLRACWSTPVFDEDGILLGTFAMYLAKPGRPTEHHRCSIEVATHTAAIAITRDRALNALRESERFARGLLEGMIVGFVALDRDWRFTYVNARATEILGRPAESMLGHRYLDVFPEALGSQFELSYRKVMAERVSVRHESYFPPWNRWFEQSVNPSNDGISIFFQDVTERVLQQRKIARLARLYAVQSGINALMVRERDRDRLIREACRIAVEEGGFRMAWAGFAEPGASHLARIANFNVDGDYLRSLPLALDPAAADFGMAGRVMAAGKPLIADDLAVDLRIKLRTEARDRGLHSAAFLPLRVAGRPIGVLALYATEPTFFDDEEMRLLGDLAGDISFALDHIEKSEKVDHLALYDQVTGLANRSLFGQRLAQHVQSAAEGERKVGVAVIDIERFKTINDSLGRHAGDELLRLVAQRFTSLVGDAGNLARLDSDHFAVVAPGLKSAESAARLAEQRLKDCFGAAFVVDGTELRISARVGIALYPEDGADAETLLRNAEAALKNAKGAGEKYLFYTAGMSARVAGRLSLENNLRQALEKDEYVLHYQPKVDLVKRMVVGAEALLRWQSAEFGLLPPARFIPLLEETGLILEVGAWALERAARDHRRWSEEGLAPPRISVNVSAVQLRNKDFVATVREAIRNGLVPTAIDIEITETMLMENIEGNIRKLHAIRDLGVSIEIDDFGTGYSSLAYLAKLPVQTLKIDHSFIVRMLDDPDTMILVQTILSLARSLRLKAVAEGVETEAQADVLRRLGCDEMQGFLISRPLPFDRMAALLSSCPSGA